MGVKRLNTNDHFGAVFSMDINVNTASLIDVQRSVKGHG